MKIISVANQKGGVGKSTTVASFGSGLRMKGKKVLYIDLDPQSNLTLALGAEQKNTIYEVITEKIDINAAIQEINEKYIIAGDPILSKADTEFTMPGREYKLKDAIEKLTYDFDYVVIDTPPALGTLTINALSASDYVIIPSEADTSSIQGITQINETILAVKKYCNKNLKVLGILLTRFSKTVISRDLSEAIKDIASSIDTFEYNTQIRECIALKETKAQQMDIFEYAPKSNAANDYSLMVEEFLEKEKEI